MRTYAGRVLGTVADRIFTLTGTGLRGKVSGGLLYTAWAIACGSAFGALLGWWTSAGQRWGAAGILAGTPVLASLKVLGDYGKIRALDRHGTRTTAVIDSQHSKYVHIPSGYSGTITTLELRFTDADGTEIRTTCRQSGRSSVRSGFPLPVIYDQRKPRVVHRVDPNGHPEAPYQFEEFCWLAVGTLGMVVLALRLVI
jgi:hypothetical protein